MKNVGVLLVLSTMVGCAAYRGETKPEVAIMYDDNGGVVLINPKNQQPVKLEPCGTDGNMCTIAMKKMKTTAVTSIVVIDSIAEDNTTCCKTYIMDGNQSQYCTELQSNTCPRHWYYK